MIKAMKALLKEKDICALATSSKNGPHCSLMVYATDDTCSEIYMVTRRDTSKYRNLQENPSVSVLIDTREEHRGSRRSEAKAMTVEGVFEKIADSREEADARSRLLKRHPQLDTFFRHPEAEVLRIRIGSFLLLDGIDRPYFESV